MTESTQVSLSIVLLNFNRIEETRYTIEKLLAMISGKPEFEIVAVDNNSEDGTADYISEKEGVKHVLLNTNDGIAGYNEGFELCRGELILVLDDDSCPKDFQCLERIIALFGEHKEMGVLACHIETPHGQPQWKWHMPHDHSFGVSPFFIGCGFAIRRDIFQKIGWYPGNFFIYQNEIDVSFKVRLLGYTIFYDPQCRVVHRGVPSDRPGWRCIFYPTRNTIWLIRKYYPQPMAAYMIFSRIAIGLGRALYLKQLSAFARGLREAFSEPIKKQLLTAEIRKGSKEFWRQNSIIHQILEWL